MINPKSLLRILNKFLLNLLVVVTIFLIYQFIDSLGETNYIIMNKLLEYKFLPFTLIPILGFMFYYLTNYLSANKKDTEGNSLNNSTKEYLRIIRKEQTKEYEKLKEDFQNLKEDFNFFNDAREDEHIRNLDKDKLTTQIAAHLSKDYINDIFNNKTAELKNKIEQELGLNVLKASAESTIRRVENELFTLKRSSITNLVLGIIITIIALCILWYTIKDFYVDISVYNSTKEKSFEELLILLLPRLSIVIFTEIFAFFFLRLYAKGLQEIKYFQNELTNIELKLIASEIAFITDDKVALKEALSSLSKTERNFILKKGETTVELERAKSESENMQNILKAVPTFLKNRGK